MLDVRPSLVDLEKSGVYSSLQPLRLLHAQRFH